MILRDVLPLHQSQELLLAVLRRTGMILIRSSKALPDPEVVIEAICVNYKLEGFGMLRTKRKPIHLFYISDPQAQRSS